jgi:hypothetical protein
VPKPVISDTWEAEIQGDFKSRPGEKIARPYLKNKSKRAEESWGSVSRNSNINHHSRINWKNWYIFYRFLVHILTNIIT